MISECYEITLILLDCIKLLFLRTKNLLTICIKSILDIKRRTLIEPHSDENSLTSIYI